ncbi:MULTISPECIES: threonine/serine dehydratase [Rhodobacterales]|jgi:threonine dehydratase|uniref:Threonine dehydratase n=1 Tax=Phaeobacter gallaeciensis TaxID=60890 RepID=A0A1B0ZT90_9RHOB|nr:MULTISPECIES: threonine/serine dehydratase [Phaeobacter]MDF1772623.1 threonine/serine dehydratase [Pseudophaeobacter sp. bin_em_oilr2.035]ANP37344.1 threonine dehydratase [Phaeobacter gallaeciensis]MDE4059555.1 threonine/serine dehydratase [Phaeobacter gallaeciensis]MDE4098146.1 threonine/serine dehydratase [Phaeobacter gallaeciensis]MDE4106956.1 threonine/serine dehydratase [Phaeobacter gallaeciensis]
MDWTSDIAAAAERIRDHVQVTPVLQTKGFDLDRPIELKLEHMQHTGSFKARGAFNTLLSCDVPEAGIVAASGGNHGAAVAYAASKLGHRARIYVPEMAGPAKISLIRDTGADLQVVPGAYANALELAQAYEQETGAMQVHAYDAPGTVAGQGTCFAEWQDQGLEADTVVIAVGGGGLIAGALAWFNGAKKIVAVEPDTSCALNAALAAGAPIDVEVSGVAANALGAKRIGSICYDLAQARGVTSVTVPDEAITRAQHALWRERRILTEPAGATALAALMSGAYQPAPGERVAVLVCGGNIAPDPLQPQG